MVVHGAHGRHTPHLATECSCKSMSLTGGPGCGEQHLPSLCSKILDKRPAETCCALGHQHGLG